MSALCKVLYVQADSTTTEVLVRVDRSQLDEELCLQSLLGGPSSGHGSITVWTSAASLALTESVSVLWRTDHIPQPNALAPFANVRQFLAPHTVPCSAKPKQHSS